MQSIIFPLPLDKLLMLSPKNFPEIFDDEGCVNLNHYYNKTWVGEMLSTINPYRIGSLGEYLKTKNDFLKFMSMDLLVMSLFPVNIFYIYITTDKWFFKNFGNFELYGY